MREERLLTIIKAPHVTEKTAFMHGQYRQYGFKVSKDATKIEIKQAIEQSFDVKVRKVRTSTVKSKEARFGQIKGRHSGWKKAYVTLEAGQEIDVASAE